MGREHYLVDVDDRVAISLERGAWEYILIQDIDTEPGPRHGEWFLRDRPSANVLEMRMRDEGWREAFGITGDERRAAAVRLASFIEAHTTHRLVLTDDEQLGNAIWDAGFHVPVDIDDSPCVPYDQGGPDV